MRASCGKTTSKVACKISAFYSFVVKLYDSVILKIYHSITVMFQKVVVLEILKKSLEQ